MSEENPFFKDDSGKEYKTKTINGVQLSAAAQKFIDDNWDSLPVMEITRHVFKDDELDGRSKEGRAVKKYMKDCGYSWTTSKIEKRENISLSEEQKQFILENAVNMKPLEIARLLFNDPSLHQFSKEALAVQETIKETNPNILIQHGEFTDEVYKPPKTFSKTIKKINESANLELEEGKLNLKAKKFVESLLGYLHNTRFIQTMNCFNSVSERQLFESQFIAQIWDKPDLSVEEINLYINLCNEYVIQARIHKIIGTLNDILDKVTDDKDGKISMSLSDAIKSKNEEYNSSVNRQNKLVNDLSGKRSNRLNMKIAANKSIVSLVEAMQQKEERKKMVDLAELRRKAVKEEMEAFETLEDFTARIFGVDDEEMEF